MIGYMGLVKIELPTHTAYLSDGGFLEYDGNTYTSKDSLVGEIASIGNMTEGANGTVEALDITFNIPDGSSITTFSSGALQRSDFRLWLAKYTVETGLIIGDPELRFLGQLDQPSVSIMKDGFSLSISVVSKAEWFFEQDTGNSLSPTFHKSVYTGETGHDNATGLMIPVAWGVASPPAAQGTASVSGGSGGGMGGVFTKVSHL